MNNFIVLIVKIIVFVAILTALFGLTLQIDFSLIYDSLENVISTFNQIINAIVGSIGNYPELYILIIFLISLAIISFIIRLLKGSE